MSFNAGFDKSLDPEILAFLHIAGIELKPNVAGNLTPTIRREGFDWVLWMPLHGDPSTMEFWKKVAIHAYGEMPSK